MSAEPGGIASKLGTIYERRYAVELLLRMIGGRLADEFALARYCATWVQWRRAQAFVDKHGTSYGLKDGNGRVKCFAPFPETALLSKLSVALSRMEAEFGLTPSARTRINIPVQPREPSDIELKYLVGPPAAL